MPEGPEVKVVVDELQVLVGQKLLNMNNYAGNVYGAESLTHIRDMLVQEIICKGKNIYIVFDNEYVLHIHLMLGGSLWVYEEDININCVVMFRFSEYSLCLRDSINLAKVKIFTPSQFEKHIGAVGVDIYEMTRDEFNQFLKKKMNSQVHLALTDQKVISGIGSYLKAEILYDAGIYPFTKIRDLTSQERDSLFDSIKSISDEIYKKGASEKHKSDSSGNGKYKFKVYKQKSVDGKPVKKEKGIYYVPQMF